MIIKDTSFTGEDIENLNSIASDHLFMHAMQTNDWKKMAYKCISLVKVVGLQI